jgi:plastocyanin
MLSKDNRRQFALVLLSAWATLLSAQEASAPLHYAEVTAHLTPTRPRQAQKTEKTPPAVIWLNAMRGDAASATPGQFTMLQKNKMFTPHLLVVPVGSSVAFPNADPFFHNVFSLFDGRRFDLGLYEAGSTRSVMFSREGVSYIFCNIHSEMSAVVISLTTPLYGFADSRGVFRVENIPNGDYNMHVWIEGQKQSTLDRLARRVRVSGEKSDLGEIHVDHSERQQHLNKFGQSYEPDAHPIY